MLRQVTFKYNPSKLILMENIEDWRKAGKIAAEALMYGKSLIKPGAKLVDVSEAVDNKILELGGKPAFPAQISCDHIAAHYCADPDDDIVFDKQVACLDVGVHINGAIGDCACTVDLSGKNGKLVEAAEKALENAIKIVKPGVTLGEIGKVIQETISSYGFAPVKNLSGHALSLFNIHDKPTIPNFDTGDQTTLEKGMVIAIEPFATTGAGMIYETDRANIFAVVNPKPVRSMITRQVFREIAEYEGLPFTTRWLVKKFPLPKVNFALRELIKLDIIKQFPPLPEKEKGLVAQAEKTLIVDEPVEVLTHY
jgi:methionyl aminopeptidase